MKEVIHGDCLEILKRLPDNSLDSLVTDPPAGISFMGKDWDGDKGGRDGWVKWMSEVMAECLRVMKPGAHGLVWALPRTSHWTATALEDAGFEIRDCVYHLFGQGFPKSLDISKAIDKAAGAEREVVGFSRGRSSSVHEGGQPVGKPDPITAPATDAAKQWQGFGTALKPAVECWWLVRKPCSEKTVAANVLKWGTGGLNLDGCRVPGKLEGNPSRFAKTDGGSFNSFTTPPVVRSEGRFPSHLVLSHTLFCTDDSCSEDCAVAQLDRQSGTLKTHGGGLGEHKGRGAFAGGRVSEINQPKDSGGASRFFYCAKISAGERNAAFKDSDTARKMSDARPGSPDLTGKFPDHDGREKRGNFHPTVKPQKLMRYLCRLVTPPGGVILDPFMGSGSTGVAAISEGFKFVGIERESEYVAIAEKRMESA